MSTWDTHSAVRVRTKEEHGLPKSAQGNDSKAIVTFSLVAGIIGGLCCLTPIVLALFGVTTIAVAAELGNVLYGEYRWAFRLVALAFLAAGLVVYFRTRGICTVDQAKRSRNRIISFSLLVLIATIGIYVFWTYVVLHYWGIAAGLPWAQYNEDWAIPTTAAILLLAFLLHVRLRNQLTENSVHQPPPRSKNTYIPEGSPFGERK